MKSKTEQLTDAEYDKKHYKDGFFTRWKKYITGFFTGFPQETDALQEVKVKNKELVLQYLEVVNQITNKKYKKKYTQKNKKYKKIYKTNKQKIKKQRKIKTRKGILEITTICRKYYYK